MQVLSSTYVHYGRCDFLLSVCLEHEVYPRVACQNVSTAPSGRELPPEDCSERELGHLSQHGDITADQHRGDGRIFPVLDFFAYAIAGPGQ